MMVKTGVCVETLFVNFAYEERIRKVAQLGFSGVEFWHYDQQYDGVNSIEKTKNLDAIARAVRETGLEVTNFLVNSPDGGKGGSLVKPENRKEYLKRLRGVIPIAHKLNCKKLTTCSGNQVERLSYEAQRKSMIDTLNEASKIVENAGITLMLEPLNNFVNAPHKGHKGCFLTSILEGAKIIREINHKNIRLLFDIYHMQIMEGNIISTIENNIDIIAHIQGAGVPGRHELWIGELNYPNIIKRLNELGYKKYFGLEYLPTIDPEESLKMIKKLLSH